MLPLAVSPSLVSVEPRVVASVARGSKAFRVEGLGLGFRFRVRVEGLGLGAWGLGFRVEGFGLRA